MSTSILKNILLLRGAADLSGKSNQAALTLMTDALEDTGFGPSDARTYTPGLRGASFNHAGFLDLGAGSYEETLWNEHGLVDQPITIAIANTAGSRAYLLNGIPSTFGVGGTVGELYAFNVTAEGTGNAARGTLIEPGTTARESTFNTAAQLVAAVPAGQNLYAALHVIAASGTSPTLDVVVQSDVDGDMNSPTGQITFAQATATGYEWASAAGAITDTYYRLAVTIGGTDPSFTFAVSVGVGA